MDNKQGLTGWAVVEQMGHNRYAGEVSEFVVGGTSLIRVDVPEVPDRGESYEDFQRDPETGKYGDVTKYRVIPGVPAFTKLLGPASIFAITPCTEAVARQVAAQIVPDPIVVLGQQNRLPAGETIEQMRRITSAGPALGPLEFVPHDEGEDPVVDEQGRLDI